MQEIARTIAVIAIPFLMVTIFMLLLARGSAEIRAFYARTYNRLPWFVQGFLITLMVIGIICMILYFFVGTFVALLLHAAVSLFGPVPFSVLGYDCVLSQIQISMGSNKLLLTCDDARIWMPIFFAS